MPAASHPARYQAGALECLPTALGACWYIRFTAADGKRPRFRVGLKAELPTKAKAARAAQYLRDRFNGSPVDTRRDTRTLADLIDRFRAEEMPTRFATARSYESYLRCHILPQWGTTPLVAIKAEALRRWLDALPLAGKTKGHVRDLVRILFRFAMLWEWLPAGVNPLTLFQIRGGQKRRARPRSLTVPQFQALLAEIPDEPYRTMVVTVACLGISCSELAGLRWRDVDWLCGSIFIRASVVAGREGPTKTEARHKPIPLHPLLAARLMAHRGASTFTDPEDWVFASPFAAGRKPYNMAFVQQYRITPAAERAGLGRLGWHALRHSYRTWLEDAGASPAEQRDLLRHADIATTMNVYGDVFQDSLRPPNDRVVRRLFNSP